MSQRFLRDNESDQWKRTDGPIACSTCLGDNPYVQIIRANFNKQCKICNRPFTVFRWRPGRDARYKNTHICQSCCNIKNVCQVCVLDRQHGLPVQVRDTAFGVNAGESSYGKVLKLGRKTPYYKRNQANICSFFVEGKCKRGSECPYRHEMVLVSGELSQQNIKDWYYGVNDPVAESLLNKAGGIRTVGLQTRDDHIIEIQDLPSH